MRKLKPLSEYQKGIYGEILKDFFNPIFSTDTSKSLQVNGLEVIFDLYPVTSLSLNVPDAKFTPSG